MGRNIEEKDMKDITWDDIEHDFVEDMKQAGVKLNYTSLLARAMEAEDELENVQKQLDETRKKFEKADKLLKEVGKILVVTDAKCNYYKKLLDYYANEDRERDEKA